MFHEKKNNIWKSKIKIFSTFIAVLGFKVTLSLEKNQIIMLSFKFGLIFEKKLV
jgi:hypothetical protein